MRHQPRYAIALDRNRLVEVTTTITTHVMVTDAADDDAAIEAAIDQVEEPRPAGWTATDEYDGKVVEL